MPRQTRLTPHLEKLGIIPDKQLAAIVDLSTEAVRRYRTRRGVPARWRGEGAPLPHEDSILQQHAAAQADAAPPRTPVPMQGRKSHKRYRSRLAPYLDQVGLSPDSELAALAGVTIGAVRKFRQRHGIPARWQSERSAPSSAVAATDPAAAPPRPPATGWTTRKPRKSKLDPYLDKVGVLPDKQVAELASVTPENVRAYRTRRGIPARWRGEGEPLPNEDAILAEARGHAETAHQAPVDELPPEPDEPPAKGSSVLPAPQPSPRSGHQQGYSVAVEGSHGEAEFVVVGADIAEAAKLALAAVSAGRIKGTVVGMRFLAQVLT